MNFGQRQRDPTKHFVGIAAVILFHGFVIYALMSTSLDFETIMDRLLETVKRIVPFAGGTMMSFAGNGQTHRAFCGRHHDVCRS